MGRILRVRQSVRVDRRILGVRQHVQILQGVKVGRAIFGLVEAPMGKDFSEHSSLEKTWYFR